MSNQFRGVGNLGQAPALQRVLVDGEQRPVADLRVYFDRSVPVRDGFKEDGGFWLNVTLWGPRAETAAKVLAKGARVEVAGQLRQETWEDEEGQARTELRLTATSIAIDPLCVESVHYRSRRNQAAAADEGEAGEVAD